MDITRAIEIKHETEEQIKALIERFEESTGLAVCGVSTSHYEFTNVRSSKADRRIAHVSLEVQL